MVFRERTTMIRLYQRKIGIRFHPDCPEHFKRRGLTASTSASEKHQIPHCDPDWVSRIDERIPGWWLPLSGFVSDEDLKALGKRLRMAVTRLLT